MNSMANQCQGAGQMEESIFPFLAKRKAPSLPKGVPTRPSQKSIKLVTQNTWRDRAPATAGGWQRTLKGSKMCRNKPIDSLHTVDTACV